ncbi:hypothetical protein E1289_33785 [Actinomadura sp. 6K520]|nr:hypothetical protein E1289_33785 [Actinomadura sp. 6K520]
MRGNSHVRFGGRPRGKGPSWAPRRAADPTESCALPVVQGEDDDAESGRGLLLMAQLVHDWGVRLLNEEGKITWARCAR